MSKLNNIIGGNWEIIKLLSFLITIVSLFLLFTNYLNNQIDDRINNPQYISKISTTLRPYQIFNENGVVLFDHGGNLFIDSIVVKKYDSNWVSKIYLYTNQYLSIATLLDYVGVYHYSYKVNRLKNNIWFYDMRPIEFLSLQPDSFKYRPPLKNIFTVEILK